MRLCMSPRGTIELLVQGGRIKMGFRLVGQFHGGAGVKAISRLLWLTLIGMTRTWPPILSAVAATDFLKLADQSLAFPDRASKFESTIATKSILSRSVVLAELLYWHRDFYKNALRRAIVPKSNRRHRRCQPTIEVRMANMSGVFCKTKATLRSAAAAC